MAKGIGGKRKLKFRTTKNEDNARRRVILAVFLTVVFVIAAISMVVLAKEYGFFGDKGGDEPVSQGITSDIEGEATILFAGVSTSKDEIDFIALITLDATNRKFFVSPVSPNERFNGDTLSAVYVENGIDGLCESVQNITGISIDRYATITEKNFKSFIAALGQIELNIPEKIEYNSDDFSINLLAGTQTLTGDKLYKYIRFAGLGGSDSALKAQAEIIGEVISQKLNETNTAKGEDLFAQLINKCDSNITIVDFTKYHSLLCEISTEPREVEALLYTSERD